MSLFKPGANWLVIKRTAGKVVERTRMVGIHPLSGGRLVPI